MTANIILGICLVLSLVAIVYLQHEAKEERKDLEDRVMALSQPISLVTTKALQDHSPADVSYMGEDEEYALSPPRDLSEID